MTYGVRNFSDLAQQSVYVGSSLVASLNSYIIYTRTNTLKIAQIQKELTYIHKKKTNTYIL